MDQEKQKQEHEEPARKPSQGWTLKHNIAGWLPQHILSSQNTNNLSVSEL